MSKLSVPKQYQQTALLVGIVLALVMRGAFIAVGAAAINQFSWVFYLFGAFLIYTAVKLARQGTSGAEDYRENALMRWTRRHLPASEDYHGVRLTVRAGRQTADHPDGGRPRRARDDRPAVRPRLDPGDLRADQGAVPGIRRPTSSR